MARDKDYYGILGVGKDATEEEIKKTYRNLAKKYHPDLHPNDKQAESRFKEINEAYGVLSNPQKRREYDMGGRVIFEGMPGREGAPPGGFDFSDFESGLGGMEDIFSEFFGGRRGHIPRKGGDIEYSLSIDFLHAVKGTDVELTVRRDGATEKVKARVPPGISDGQRVRVAGRGNPGVSGGPAGDLYITVGVKPHPYFRREKNDIYVEVPVTVQEAAFGADVEVPTIEGKTKIKIPAGVQGGQKLRLRGKGVPSPQGAGDEYVIIRITVPKKVDKRTKELLEELEKINPYHPREDLW
ncbi:MAG: DnaJ domain-containing protein [Deltaproteobacteria bacterium]|nr:DnaJ domain-containing protein [Deltaproteobacteria bacterium]